MFRIALFATSFLIVAMPSASRAQDAADLATRFGMLEAVQDISVSPDGRYIAYVTPLENGGEALLVVDLAGDGSSKAILTSSSPAERIFGCVWPGNERLICQVVVRDKVAGEVLVLTRVIAVNRDGSDVKLLASPQSGRALYGMAYGGAVIDFAAGGEDEVLMERQYVPESDLNTRLAQKNEGIGVDRVNIRSFKRTNVEKADKDAFTYITDGQGNVRIMGSNPIDAGGYGQSYYTYLYRTAESRNWQSLSRVEFSPEGITSGFAPVAVDPSLGAVYGFEPKDGFSALYSVKLDGSLEKKLVLAVPGAEVDELIRIGRDQRVVGVSYATEYRKAEYFDPKLKVLRKALGGALPDQPLVEFVDATAGEKQLLIFAGSDDDPGTYYLFDQQTNQLEELLKRRPQLAKLPLATVKPVTYAAADGTMIPAYLTLPPGGSSKNLPAIVMPHGGPAARDEWGFDWLAQYFAARGYAVLQPNFRGSAGYGAQWFEANGFQSWRTAIGDIDDGGRWLLQQGIAADGQLAIFGWSYGGYAALQSGVFEPGLFKAIVAVAPVTDLQDLRSQRRDYRDFKIVSNFIGDGPHIVEGSPARNAAKIQVPVLMFHGEWDTNVDISQSRAMESALKSESKSVDLVTYQGLEHSLLSGSARKDMLLKVDAFLRRNLRISD